MSGAKHTTFVLGLGGPPDDDKSKSTVADDDGDMGGDGAPSEETKEAALDVAEALGVDRNKVDGEKLAMALREWYEACEKDSKGGDEKY